ncbi:restriction endonuclease [Paenarthrobacter sp. PH39-S1]|uniref:restriction endonuclease n=1 Tax=Paenarthrobacter sp. PH39-S1 TaxID=3046204 RepID=UPI0024B8FDDA|nr:restriction endonuclease [Paenarthrobacter sp. PH39-S1]MDJ0357941.1 restriction endonuclease [Paenarthrobacter sp. PH39-S1]
MAKDYRDYENGIADVVEFLVRGRATVSRDVYLQGHQSNNRRQIDVLVEGHQFGINRTKLIIDCKNYAKALDVNAVGTFASMVQDVGAEAGWLVTTMGYSEAAANFIESRRGLRVHVMPLQELLKWRPKGTRSVLYAFKSESARRLATDAVRKKGFRARAASPGELTDPDPTDLLLEVFRYYKPPEDGDILAVTEKAIRDAGANEFRNLSTSVVIGGGTPGHRWLPLTIKGHPTEIKLNVANDADAREQIKEFATHGILKQLSLTIPDLTIDDLDIERPDVWPVPGLFPEQLGL